MAEQQLKLSNLMMKKLEALFLLTAAVSNFSSYCSAFSQFSHRARVGSELFTSSDPPNGDYEKKNAAVGLLSNFMQKEEKQNPLDEIDFDAPKFQKVPIDTLASILDYELTKNEWFVTGNVNPVYFSDNFEFQDPDVKLSGIESYARGVYKLFDQETARAEIISSVASNDDTITVTWRLSGKVNIGPGLTIKPYICFTNFTVNEESGLIDFQEDEFDIPQWDVLLSSLFPFLIGTVTSPPAPPVNRQDVPRMPTIPNSNGKSNNPAFIDSILELFKS